MPMRIMSSNVWGNCPPDRPIADRDDKMAVVYLRYLPDCIGLQECSPRLRGEKEHLFSLVSEVYGEVTVTVTNEKKTNFTPILYRKDKLCVRDAGWTLFDGPNDQGSKSITWALFEDRTTAKRFLHFNAHYFWMSDEKGRTARIGNTEQLLSLVGGLAKQYPVPVVITGDFNCITDEPPIIKLLASGFAETRLCALETGVPYRSHHACPEIDTTCPERVCYPRGHMPDGDIDKSLDHIFVSQGVDVHRYQTVVDDEALQSSDHCPLLVEITIP